MMIGLLILALTNFAPESYVWKFGYGWVLDRATDSQNPGGGANAAGAADSSTGASSGASSSGASGAASAGSASDGTAGGHGH